MRPKLPFKTAEIISPKRPAAPVCMAIIRKTESDMIMRDQISSFTLLPDFIFFCVFLLSLPFLEELPFVPLFPELLLLPAPLTEASPFPPLLLPLFLEPGGLPGFLFSSAILFPSYRKPFKLAYSLQVNQIQLSRKSASQSP